MKKWFLSILLVLVMVITSLPVNVLAEGGSSLTDSYGEFVSGGQVLSDLIAKNGENAHPRIIMTDERFNKLKGSIGQDSVTGTLLEKLRSEANRLLSSPVSEYDISDGIRLLETSKRIQRRVATLAMAYNIFGEEEYAQRCYAELEAACNFADWNPSHFLDTAEMCTAFALGYDWLYDWMNEDQRALLRNNMIEKGLKQGMEDYEDVPRERTYKWYQDYPGDNWKLVCNGGLSLAALAIGDEADAKEIASKVLTYAYKEAYSFVRRAYSEKDGTYTEGLGYWDYATYYLGLFSSALKSTAGKDYGLANHEGLRKSADFIRYMSSNTSKSFSFGDDGDSRDTGWAVLLWLAEYYEDYDIATPRLKKIEDDSFNYLDLLWIDEEKATVSAGDSSTDWGEVGASNASFRNTWDESGIVAALHTGLNNYKYHGHYDLGSFYIESNGARFFTDLGNEDYELSNRKFAYRIKAEGHNTLVINPSAELDQKEGAECLITAYGEGNEAYAVTDLTAAYEDSDAKSVQRGLKMIKDKECVIIQDEISLNAPGEIYWFGHTKGQIEVAADGRSAIVTVGSERLWVGLISDAGTFNVMNAELLSTSPAVSGQTDNSEYRKLAIHLTDTQDTTISVACIPLKSGETQPLWTPSLQEIADWDSENIESCTHEHKTRMSDSNSHWYRCVDCGSNVEKNPHSGGAATCKEQATCMVCDAKYGALTDHGDADHDGRCDVCSKVVGTITSWKFDFGNAGVEEGYIGVSAEDGYDAEVGYGFANTDAVENVLASGTGALADAVKFKSDVSGHVFHVDLPSGVYKITVTTGDVQSTTIKAEGLSQLFFLTGSNATDSFTIPVTDGQLNIYAGSGVGTEFSVSALEIERTSTGTTTKPTIWTCGDSTVASYYNVSEDAKRGWGQYLSNYVDMDTYDIRNLSASGLRSADLKRSFFGTAEYYGKSGDIILFAVGINDYTDEYKAHPDEMDSSTYIANMTEMIQRAKAKGMTVYLVKQQGELRDSKSYPIPTEKWFDDEIEAMAASENVGIIDLFSPWLTFCLENTYIEAKKYYAPGENLHPNALGANKLAQMVSEQLFPEEEEEPEEDVEDLHKDFDNATTVYYEMESSGQAVANPHKGFVMTVYNPDMLYEGQHPYGIGGSMENHAWDVVSIVSGVLFWEDLNPGEGVYDFEAIDTMLAACEQAGMTYGIRIIPYTTSKGSDANFGEEHDFVPKWVYDKGAQQKLVTYKYGDPDVQIKVPDWSDPVYIKAYKDFTKALADKYNGDPRVEYVEIRAFGNMGEWHDSEFVGIEMPSLEIQKDMLDYFAEVFDKTTCCLMSDGKGEIYEYALSKGITKRNNGLILKPNEEWDLVPAYKANLPTMADNHNTYEYMLDKNGTLSDEYLKWTPERFRETIEIAHLSIYALDQEGYGSYQFYREQKELIDEMANRLGYNFTVTSVKRNGNKLLVTIKNTGVAPAFFDIVLSAEITDAEGSKLGDFGVPVTIESGSFHDGEEKSFLFEYNGTLEEDISISLAMYESAKLVTTYARRSARAVAQNPTVKFDNKYILDNNRLMLVVDESLHTHDGTLVPKQDPSCTEFGVKAYYKCACGMFFTDAACTSEITDLEAWKSGAGRIWKESHTGGKATCEKMAKCTVCKAEYGELADHEYDTEWKADKADHWKECAVCETQKDRAVHEDANGDGKCDVCGKTVASGEASPIPTEAPTPDPMVTPTVVPTKAPAEASPATPTETPAVVPTDAPTEKPTEAPVTTLVKGTKDSAQTQPVSEENPTEAKAPQTGDDSNPWLFAGVGCVAFLAGISIALRKRKDKYIR